jgi:hypothetical protein
MLGPEYPPEYDQPDPPCIDGLPCECDLCTCQKCGEKLDDGVCPNCDDPPNATI